VAANNCLLHASGKYVAWMSSDDAWYPEKLAVQVSYLEAHPEIGAVFGKVEWVDELGKPVAQSPYMTIYEVENRTRQEWLRQFFVTGNCLSMPCSLVRRDCFSQIGAFDPAFAGIPDLDLWVRICLKYEIMILDQKLIRNRWLGDEANASGDSAGNNIRNRLEYRHILDHYLRIHSADELLRVFPEAGRYGTVTPETIPYVLARIAIDSRLDFKMLWGLDVIHGLLQDEAKRRALEEACAFLPAHFIRLARECDTLGLAERQSLAELVLERDRAVHELRSGLAFQMLAKYRRLVDLLLPVGSARRRLYARIASALRVRLFDGPRPLLSRAKNQRPASGA
jgi:glycosyltransferase involved in cell wall biosynthesis